MTDAKELLKLFHDKLGRTGSLDAAFLKAVWVAFKSGLAAGVDSGRIPDDVVAALRLAAAINPYGSAANKSAQDAARAILERMPK